MNVHALGLGECWSLKVANTGPGIALEHQPHLFERFFRAEHFARITGHGLILAHELAREQGGDLTLARAEVEWTEFQLILPTAPIPKARRLVNRRLAVALPESADLLEWKSRRQL